MLEQSFKEIIKGVKKGAFASVYFLYGDEPYYIHKLIQTAEYFIRETNNENNLFILDGKKQTLNDALLLLQETGMFSNFRLIIVRDAHQLKEFSTSLLKDKNTNISSLLKFIQNPIPEHQN